MTVVNGTISLAQYRSRFTDHQAYSVAIADSVISVENAWSNEDEKATSSAAFKVVAAIAGLCNDASFADSSSELPIQDRLVVGDATGEPLSYLLEPN